MTKLQEYAQRMTGLFALRVADQTELNHLTAQLAERSLALTPSDGWPGKNEEQRNTAREKTLEADELCRQIKAQIGPRRDRLAEIEGEIEAVRELASAERWAIRERLANALTAKYDPTEDQDREPGMDAEDGEALAEVEAVAEALPW